MDYKVGDFYMAKEYKDCGYNFPSGKYKLKAINDGFPDKPINNENELDVAKEQWLEGVMGTDQYEKDVDSNWFFWEFPDNENNIDYMWIPEAVVREVFTPINN
jgi:hypothetical protein